MKSAATWQAKNMGNYVFTRCLWYCLLFLMCTQVDVSLIKKISCYDTPFVFQVDSTALLQDQKLSMQYTIFSLYQRSQKFSNILYIRLLPLYSIFFLSFISTQIQSPSTRSPQHTSTYPTHTMTLRLASPLHTADRLSAANLTAILLIKM